jgi:methylglutaconyl-CoA hydratase
MSTHLVKREDRGPITILTLNRPEKRNALSQALVAGLRDHIDRINTDESVRVVVVTGAGPAFCAGMDLKEALAVEAGPDEEERTVAILQEFADLLDRLHTLSRPTIAAVNGDALAGGAGLVAACDLAIAAESARIGYPEVLRGLVPAIVMHDLTRQIGDRRARQLLLSGAPISARVAHQWGLINGIAPADLCLDEAIQAAIELTRSGPLAMASIKRILDESAGRPGDLRGAAAVSAAVRCSSEAREGIRAFIDKRSPAWVWSQTEENAP